MATLSIVNSFSLNSFGLVEEGKQGLAASGIADEYDITVTGTVHRLKGQLATATVVTLYDDDNDVPVDWDYGFIWTTGTAYVQVVGSATNFTIKIAAYQPFVIPGFDSILAAADTTIITGGSEPSVTDIDSVVLGNYSGSTIDFLAAFID